MLSACRVEVTNKNAVLSHSSNECTTIWYTNSEQLMQFADI